MSKKKFTSQASSSRAVTGTYGRAPDDATFGSGFGSSVFGAVHSSPLSYIYEPPDLSGLSDPNVGVAFKNVQKKDGTTKAKALEDLQSYISSVQPGGGGIEEAMLEAWIKVYPRTSIDNYRRVRQLAHTLQGQIALSCGKRIAKHMPIVAPSWLAGLYDTDKSVSRAANESLTRVFTTEEKRENVWRLYQSSILEYSRDAVTKETTATLSDERTTSPDDASAKYSRVIGAVILMVTSLLENTPEADLEKSRALLEEFLNEGKVWKLATHSDSFVRRALYRLIPVTLAKQRNSLNQSLLSTNLLMSGLRTDQTGSALDFTNAISILTEELPDVWTLQYAGTGKQSARSRLKDFLKKGSRGGPSEFWSSVSSLLSRLPPSILTSADEDGSTSNADDKAHSSSSLLSALLEGINSKDEPRANQGSAWKTYLDAFELLQALLPDPVDRQGFYGRHLLPILRQYIRPSPELTGWTLPTPQRKPILLRVCSLTLLHTPKAFEDEWQALSTQIIDDLKTSLPEQSKEYAKSQDSIAAETGRWYQLQSSLLGESSGTALISILEQSLPMEANSALTIIKNRNGKPYGAAAALHTALKYVPGIVLGNGPTRKALLDFAHSVIPELMNSPSTKYLIQILDHLEENEDVSQAYERCMEKLAELPESDAKSNALQTFMASPRLARSESLPALVPTSLQRALKDDDEPSWKLVMAALSNPVAPKGLTEDALVSMVDDLSIHAASPTGLHGLEMAAKHAEGVVKEFALSSKGSSLLSVLLSLSASTDDNISQRAKSLSTLVEQALTVSGSAGQATTSMLHMIQSSIDTAGAGSLGIDIVIIQAQKLLVNTSPEDMPELAAQLLPNTAQWTTAMEPFTRKTPNPSLAVTNTLGGALSLISPPSSTSNQSSVARDEDGNSSAFRMAKYTTKMIGGTKAFDYVTNVHKAVIYKNLALFLQLASDNLSISGAMPLWSSADPDQESEVIDLVAETQTIFASWLTSEPSISGFVHLAQSQLLKDANGRLASSYYSGRAYSALAVERKETHGHRGGESDTDRLKTMRKSADVFASAAYLTAAPESKELQRLCNELVADLTDHDFQGSPDEGLRILVLLSCIIHGAEDYVTEIPQQRLIFLVKHIIPQLETVQPSSALWGQITSMLTVILPPINGIYGEFWADILDAIEKGGLRDTRDESLFGINTSLRLLSLLRRPHMQEANDDLLDAWNEKKAAIGGALVVLMTQLADNSDESHQPRRTINELLGRQLTALSNDLNIEALTLYPVLASESTALQEAAYNLLHSHIPSTQEQVSVDKALSADTVAQLPQELLSLILTAPTIEYLAESNFERTIPSTLRSYLLSWKLTLDHWQNASYKVQADYVATLQEGTYVQDFLNLAFNILINARTKPVDASKYNIEKYTPGIEESPEKETHWLLIHLYYLSLRHLPSLTKTWWRDSTSRQLNLSVSSWTEKYISPLIISSELSTITSWAPSQSTADQPMTIKVSPAARELTASIPIDEQTMTIAIHLPKSYPLARAEVTSVHRVGVAEKKWNFWLINTQGVINFSSGGAGEGNALIDGLMAWRKNVTAAMKGQTECAICYSVVSGDRQLPSKKCQTCKNMFHSSCLFRWFKSSNSSSCPLCRNAFHYS